LIPAAVSALPRPQGLRDSVTEQRYRVRMDAIVDLLVVLLERCEERGLAFPLIVTVMYGDDCLFCSRVSGVHEDGMELLHCDRDIQIGNPPLPISIYVTDHAGADICITAEDPDTPVLH
jgi:hypothetical protein